MHGFFSAGANSELSPCSQEQLEYHTYQGLILLSESFDFPDRPHKLFYKTIAKLRPRLNSISSIGYLR